MTASNNCSPEQALTAKISKSEVQNWMKQYAMPYRELISYFHCAMLEVETKFKVLSEDLSLRYDRNPIENIKTRLKSPESIFGKMLRRGHPLTVSSIEENIHDIAGVRIICAFQSDIYLLADALLKQDDVTLIEKKDYIASPKDNGYRSLHLIVAVPIYLHDTKKLMKVEIQFRTLAMDLWASTEHKIRYKKDAELTRHQHVDLYTCAEICAEIDKRMEEIYHSVRREE